MIRYAPLLIFALTLGGCCLSGNCYAPMAAGAPGPGAPAGSAPVAAAAPMAAGPEVASVNPDGLVTTSLADDGQEEYLPPPARKTSSKPRKSLASRSDRDGSAPSRSRGEEAYEEQLAADRADDEQLKRKLIICQNCSTKGNADN